MPEEPPADIMALIDAVLSGFNSKNATLYMSAFGDSVVIIDGFAPFRWVGPNAPAQWWADAETWAKTGGVESEHLSSQGILYWEVRGIRAYAVVSATLTIMLKQGAPITRHGILTFTFGKLGEVWKAEGHAWGRMSSHRRWPRRYRMWATTPVGIIIVSTLKRILPFYIPVLSNNTCSQVVSRESRNFVMRVVDRRTTLSCARQL